MRVDAGLGRANYEGIAMVAQATYFVVSALLSWTSMTYGLVSKSPRLMPDMVVVLLPCAILFRAYLGTGFGFTHVPECMWMGCEPF